MGKQSEWSAQCNAARERVARTGLCDCGHAPSAHESFTTGYGYDRDAQTACYACCAEKERESMRASGRAVLYVVQREGKHYVTDWPGHLALPVTQCRKGRHDFARVRYDIRFRFEGTEWAGTQYGDNTQIVHCRKLK